MSFYSAALTLFLIFDPFGNIPVFLSELKNIPEPRRKLVIVREMFIALAVLLLFLFFGTYILTGMQISEPALAISGGIILFLIALKMIFPGISFISYGELHAEPIIVPLAVPLIAGPSAMAILILVSSQYREQFWIWFWALLIAWFASFIIIFYSDLILKFIGDPGINAVQRLMGMILTTIAVQMLLNGVRMFVINFKF